jgi:hypothetical protein
MNYPLSSSGQMYKVLPDTKKESIIFYHRIAWSRGKRQLAVENQDTRNKSKDTSGSGSGSNLENIKHKTLNIKQNKGKRKSAGATAAAVENQDTINKSKETSGSDSGSNLENIKHKTLNIKQNKGVVSIGSRQLANFANLYVTSVHLCVTIIKGSHARLTGCLSANINGQAKDAKNR